MPVGVFVGQLDLDPIVVAAITHGAEHPVVHGLALDQDSRQVVSQRDDVGVVGLDPTAGLLDAIQPTAPVTRLMEARGLDQLPRVKVGPRFQCTYRRVARNLRV